MLKNRIIVIGLFIASSVYVYLEPNFITILLFYTLTLIILLSYLHLLLANKNVVITQVINPNRVPHSTKIKYTLNIKNRSLFPYPLVKVRFKYAEEIFTDQLDSLKIVLHSEESLEYNFDLSCKYRGIYNVGVDEIEVHDILNVFRIKRPMKAPMVTVLPKVSIIASNHIQPKYLFSEYDFDKVSSLDQDTIKDIRDYQRGDSLKDVHWKLYAKYNNLMVKDKENSAINKSIVFLDTNELDSSFVNNIIYQDKLLEAFLSTTQRLMDDNHVLDVLIHNQILTDSTFYTFESIFNTTSDIEFSKEDTTESLEQFMEENYKNKNLSGIDVFVFTLKDSEQLQSILEGMVSNSMNVHVFETNPSLEESIFLADNHIRYYHLEKSSNIGNLFKDIG